MTYNETLINDIKEKLLQKDETIAVAESVTAGNLQVALSLAVDASKFFQGGITTYNLGQKARHLNVEPIHSQNCNCISDKVAATMAIGAASMFTSEFGIGITGYASVVPENDQDGIFAFVAISYKNEIVLSRRITSTESDNYTVQVDYTNQVIQLLHGWLYNT